MTYADGTRFEGTFEDGVRVEGTFYFANGDWINGKFTDDSATGIFLFYRASDASLDYAYYDNGAFVRYVEG